MSQELQQTNKAVQPWSEFSDDDGLGDVQQSDITLPRLNIIHKEALFKDSSTGAKFEVLNAIILGIVKQRIMWDSEVDEGDKPQCKSPDFNLGYPQMRTDIDESKQFPWAASVFDETTVQLNDEGLIVLPCESCNFKEWTKKGTKSVKPLCSEQWTMPLYYFLENDDTPYPAIISVQRSGAKAAKTYAGSFKAQRQPMFTVMTQVTLTQEARGSVDYCSPGFRRGEATSPDQWRDHSEMYRGIREMLHEPPRGQGAADEEEAPVTAPTAAPARTVPPAPTRTAPPAAPKRPPSAVAATRLPDDDPWATAAPMSPAASVPDDELPF
jgi:hypothetical protein